MSHFVPNPSAAQPNADDLRHLARKDCDENEVSFGEKVRKVPKPEPQKSAASEP